MYISFPLLLYLGERSLRACRSEYYSVEILKVIMDSFFNSFFFLTFSFINFTSGITYLIIGALCMGHLGQGVESFSSESCLVYWANNEEFRSKSIISL